MDEQGSLLMMNAARSLASQDGKLELRLERDQTSRIGSVVVSHRHVGSSTSDWIPNTGVIDVNSLVIEFLNSLQRKQVGTTPLTELLVHRGWGLWQFLPSYLFYWLRLSIEIAERLSDIVSTTQARSLLALQTSTRDQQVWSACVEQICATHGLRHVGAAAPPRMDLALARHLRNMGLRRPNLLHPHHRLRRSAKEYGAHLLPSDHRSGAILFVSLPTHWVKRNQGHYDDQMTPIAEELRSLGEERLVGMDTPYYTHGSKSIESFRHKVSSDRLIRWTAFDSFESRAARSVERSARRRFRRMWKQLSARSDFKALFDYRGIHMWPILAPHLRDVFHRTLPEVVRAVEIASRALDTLNPKAVVLTYEQGPYQRALILEASRRGIPTFGLQGGALNGNCEDVLHAGITANPVAKPFGFAVPTITFLWGEYFRRVLTENGHFPPESLMVTGHWRYDAMAVMRAGSTGGHTCPDKGTDMAGKTVVVLTGGLDSLSHLRVALGALRSFTGLRVLIKLHPREQTDAPVALIKSFGYSDENIVDGQLQHLLSVADMVITEDSCSTVVEAALFDKPAIVGSYDNRLWDASYEEEGICLKVHADGHLPLKVGAYPAKIRVLLHQDIIWLFLLHHFSCEMQ